VTGGFKLACALLGIAAAGCQQTWVLDESALDGGRPGTGGTSGVGPSDASVDGRCFGNQTQQITATPDTPEVVVALDRSMEMTETSFGQQDTEFTAALSDLSAEVGNYAFTAQHPSRRAISFGYLQFPDGSNGCPNQGCCASTVTAAPDYTHFTGAAKPCEDLPSTCGPSTNRPIAAALASAYAHFQSESLYGGGLAEERYVLLVAADAPGTNCSTENDCQAAQDQISMLVNDLNVWTVIIHVGTSTMSGCLQNLATTQPGPPPSWYAGSSLYYDSEGPMDLQTNIGNVIYYMANGACRFTLSATPSAPNQLTVLLGQGLTMSTTVPPGTSGWTYDSDNGTPRLILHGSYCMDYILDSQFAPQVFPGCIPDHNGQPPP
jgi:hypothetical protein